jgi:glycosyltransferase involved in cell wall biosynthesis
MTQEQGQQSGPVFISVVIPARNEEDFLPATIEALKAQSYRNFEIIVVANGCQDRTADVARELGCRVFELGDRGLGAARNLGGREAHGQILVFLDADTLLPKESLKTIAAKFRRCHSCGTLWGEPDSRRLSYKLIYAMKNLIHALHVHCGSSGVILCWKDDFMRIGGFDESLYLRENSHLMKRLLRFGRYRFIARTPCITSMRRYETNGAGEMVRLWLKVWWRSLVSDISNATYEDLEQEAADRRYARLRLDQKASV